MRANLYLHTESLQHNGVDNQIQVEKKFKQLISDLIEARRIDKDNNLIKISPNIYTVKIYKEQDFYTFIQNSLDREERNFIFSILHNTSEECDNSLNDLLEKSQYHVNETECNAVLILNSTIPTEDIEDRQEYLYRNYTNISFNTYQLIYDFQSWRTLRRQILGNHPVNAENFINECKLYFPNLYFHPQCKNVISNFLRKIPRTIIIHLSCMNDCFNIFRQRDASSADANTILEEFAGKYNLETGSLQRNAARREELTFNFPRTNNPNIEKPIYCEPHFKITRFDDNYRPTNTDDLVNFNARIYFHFGDPEVADNRILIGSIGPHV